MGPAKRSQPSRSAQSIARSDPARAADLDLIDGLRIGGHHLRSGLRTLRWQDHVVVTLADSR
jgi:hypothetical protein